MSADRVDVAVVGAGPAGLAAATELRRTGVGSVLVIDREAEAGGIPRHAAHQGFGLRDLRRVMSGPRYARRRTELALAAGAELRLRAQVTGWTDDGELEITEPGGRSALAARAVVLATGCRERPRSARLVPGSRPPGVMTTGMLQQLVYLNRERVGSRAVVIGAEHVSFSALLTLRHGGARTVAMATERPRHESFALFRAGAALRFRTPLRTRTAITAIHGTERVESVELTDLDSGRTEEIPCDLVVFTADWIPDHELAVLGGARLDPGTQGPVVDAGLRTTRPGVFAAGNVLRGAETADAAALEGREVAASVAEYLGHGTWPPARVAVSCEAPLRWVIPNSVAADGATQAPQRPFLLRAAERLRQADLVIAQDGRTLERIRLRRVMVGRSARLDPCWLSQVDLDGGPVHLRVGDGP
jgi:thioredoxin reductase